MQGKLAAFGLWLSFECDDGLLNLWSAKLALE